ncbi:MAG: thioesterase family protein, partial [Bacteroidota bacterium]
MKLSLNDYKITAEYPVHWGDMDAAKHVNNLVYLRWTESGRLLYFQAMNMDTSFHEVGPILGWQDCKYIFPMT